MYDKINAEIKNRWDSIAKPIDGLGKFEELICKIGAVQGSTNVDISKKAMVVFCSDNGVVAEGVAQTDSSVTALVAENITKGVSTVAKMASTINCECFSIDVGIAKKVDGVIDRSISRGTKNLAKEPAMTIDQAKKALQVGIDTIKCLKNDGFNIVAIGEMGIGNTTTAAAVASVILNIPAETATGRGSGLTDSAFEHKKSVIRSAIELHNPRDIWAAISSLGGYDIIAMAGAILGGLKYGVPVIIDGAVSAVSALIACKMDENAIRCIIPSHLGREPLAKIVMKELDLEPVICADMALGEGSGAIMLFPLLDMAISIYNNKTFEQLNMEEYKRN